MEEKLYDSRNIESEGWLVRAEQAKEEFESEDSSQRTNANLWKDIAREYNLTEDLEEFRLQFSAKRHPKDIFDVPLTGKDDLWKYVARREIKENVLDFFKLRKIWKSFFIKYSPFIERGEEEKLWHLFWGDSEIEKWGALQKMNIVRGKHYTKKEIQSLVKQFGMEEVSYYRELVGDVTFMNEVEEIRKKASRYYN